MANSFPNPYEAIHRELQTVQGLCVEILTSINNPKSSADDPYFKCNPAAEFLGITPNALRVKVCKNQIKSIKKGNSLYFLESDLIEYLESGRRKTPAELAQNCEDALVIKKGGFQK